MMRLYYTILQARKGRQGFKTARAAILLPLALFLCLACSGARQEEPSLSIRVAARGEIEVTWTPPRPAGEAEGQVPDVRYSTAPLTAETWGQAPAVTPWTPVTVAGTVKLRSRLPRLAPVLHYVAAASPGARPGISPVATVLPLRETVLHGRLGGDYFGHAVALVGDVNGDGYGDLLVGAPWSDEGMEAGRPRYARWARALLRRVGVPLHGARVGAAYLYPGGAGGPAPNPAWTLLGKVEGDALGSVVAGVGDLNGDGFADFAIGIPGHDTRLRNEGAVAVYFGRPGPLPSEPDLFLVGRSRDESFGSAIAGGDFNGDGYADLVVGAPGSYLGEVNAGAVFVYYGGPAGPASRPETVLVGKTFDGLFGSAVAAVGDVNGDGYGDLLVGAYEGVADPRATGAAYLYYGGPRGLATAPALMLRGQGWGDQFGAALAALGDVDGDGFADFAVGAPKNDEAGEDAGAVYVYHGGPRGPLSEPRTRLLGPGPGSQFGTTLAGIGDLDGDGHADLLVGAFAAGGAEEGAVFLYRGAAAGLGPRPALTLHGRHPGAHLGRGLAGGGDLDGDGRPDLAVGAEGDRSRGPQAGAVFLRY